MFEILDKKIKEYNNIYITRHARPDSDALGSQLGLKQIILDNYNNKNVFAIGDMSRPSFLGQMDDCSIIKDSLLIVTDTSVIELLPPDIDLSMFKEIICIDHHKNDCNINNALTIYDKDAAAACQIIANFTSFYKLNVSLLSFRCLFSGIIGDTNRFNYSLSVKLFDTMSYLISLGYDYKDIYNQIYEEKIGFVKMKAYFTSKFISDESGVAYMFNNKEEISKFNTDFFTVSRLMVNTMANIEGINIWVNFTEDPATNKVIMELRSKKIAVLPIAKEYGGGGHELACGATLDNFGVAYEVLNKLKKLSKEG